MIAAVLLAAGRAHRYGGAKLLESFEGETLLRRAARALTEGGCAPLIVVVRPEPAFARELEGFDPLLIENPDPSLGVSHSIALGVRAVPEEATAVLIAVADQPRITGALVRQLAQAFTPGGIVAARYGAAPGNPRIYDRRFFAELQQLAGDRGGQVLVKRHPEAVRDVSFPATMGVDIDTPDDWKRVTGG